MQHGMRRKIPRRSPGKGTTLVELMIATFVFGFLSIMLLGILNFGTKTWRNVESRSSVETDMRRAVMDMNREIKDTIITSVVTGTFTPVTPAGCGPQFYLCFASLVRDGDSEDLRFWTYNGTDPTTAYFSLIVNPAAQPSEYFRRIRGYNRWILYYTIRPFKHDQLLGTCSPDIPGSSIYRCPHKLLMKKELWADLPSGAGTSAFKYPHPISGPYTISNANQKYECGYWPIGGPFKRYMNPNDCERHMTPWTNLATVRGSTEGNKNAVKSVTLLARHVLVFTTNFLDTASDPMRGDTSMVPQVPEVQYTLRCFKIMEYGLARGTNDLYNLAPSMSVQINSKTIPYRDEGGTDAYDYL